MSFINIRKNAFLESIPKVSIEDKCDYIARKCKFNFSYFDHTQEPAQNFSDWSNEQLLKLLWKLHEYSKESLLHWQKMPVGKKSGHVLEIYKSFPNKSDFSHPKHVPHQAQWGRFRLEGSVRLVGFTIPDDFKNIEQNSSGFKFCTNTFYVVFLDKDHRFYKTK